MTEPCSIPLSRHERFVIYLTVVKKELLLKGGQKTRVYRRQCRVLGLLKIQDGALRSKDDNVRADYVRDTRKALFPITAETIEFLDEYLMGDTVSLQGVFAMDLADLFDTIDQVKADSYQPPDLPAAAIDEEDWCPDAKRQGLMTTLVNQCADMSLERLEGLVVSLDAEEKK